MIPGAAADVVVARFVGVDVGACCDGEASIDDCETATELGTAGAGAGLGDMTDFDGCDDACGVDDDSVDGNEIINGTSLELAATVAEDTCDTKGDEAGCPALLTPAGAG